MFRPNLAIHSARPANLIYRAGIRNAHRQLSWNAASPSTSLSLKQTLFGKPAHAWSRVHAAGLAGIAVAGGLGLAVATHGKQVVQCDGE